MVFDKVVKFHNRGYGIIYRLVLATIVSMSILTIGIGQPPVDNLEFLGSNQVNPAHLMDVEVSVPYAFGSVGFTQGLETYDISNPYNPSRLSYGGNSNWRSRAYGDTLFVFCRSEGLDIYGIRNGAIFVGNCPAGASDRLFEGGALHENKMYVAAHQEGIIIVDISNLNSPFITGEFALYDNACWNIEASGDYLFVANGRFGLSVVQVEDELAEIAVLDLPGLANDIVINDNTAFLTLGAGGVAAVDISQPENPQIMDIHSSMGCAWGMGNLGTLAVVGSWRYMELFDFSQPDSIFLAGWENTDTWAMGADMGILQNDTIITVADWRGIATYSIGSGNSPDIEVYPMRVDFGAITQPADSSVVIRNTGGGLLSISNINTPNGITADITSIDLSAGDSVEVNLHAEVMTVFGSVHYISNDPDEPDFIQRVYVNNTSFPQVGSESPDFTLTGTDGNTYTLSELRGNVVFLEFGGGW